MIYPAPSHTLGALVQNSPPTSTTAKPKADLSPAMRQYQDFKSQYPGYVLFFRMGDFYEMFWEDARTAAKVLGVGADEPEQRR